MNQYTLHHLNWLIHSYLTSKPVIHRAKYDLIEVYDPCVVQKIFLVHFAPEIIGIVKRDDE